MRPDVPGVARGTGVLEDQARHFSVVSGSGKDSSGQYQSFLVGGLVAHHGQRGGQLGPLTPLVRIKVIQLGRGRCCRKKGTKLNSEISIERKRLFCLTKSSKEESKRA